MCAALLLSFRYTIVIGLRQSLFAMKPQHLFFSCSLFILLSVTPGYSQIRNQSDCGPGIVSSSSNWFTTFNAAVEQQAELGALQKAMKHEHVDETKCIFDITPSGDFQHFQILNKLIQKSHLSKNAEALLRVAADRVAPLNDPYKRKIIVLFTEKNGQFMVISSLDSHSHGPLGRQK